MRQLALTTAQQRRLERLAREAGRTSKAMLQFVLRDGFEACEEDVRENLAADAEFASGKNVTHKEAMRRARSAIGSGRGRTCAVDRGAADSPLACARRLPFNKRAPVHWTPQNNGYKIQRPAGNSCR